MNVSTETTFYYASHGQAFYVEGVPYEASHKDLKVLAENLVGPSSMHESSVPERSPAQADTLSVSLVAKH